MYWIYNNTCSIEIISFRRISDDIKAHYETICQWFVTINSFLLRLKLICLCQKGEYKTVIRSSDASHRHLVNQLCYRFPFKHLSTSDLDISIIFLLRMTSEIVWKRERNQKKFFYNVFNYLPKLYPQLSDCHTSFSHIVLPSH